MFVLCMTCNTRTGIVSRYSDLLFKAGGNILEINQYNETDSGLFFMRIAFILTDESNQETLTSELTELATRLEARWTLHDQTQPQRVLLMVSKFDHCLIDLLYRWRIGELKMQPVAIVSNHPRESLGAVDLYGIPFHHFPVTPATKPQQEARLLDLIRDTGTQLTVLARYMQVLSDEMSTHLRGQCINIHHSFLPGFKGARPYLQAWKRGVKLIGATAHYVTPDLDEGPIIEQDVERINHADTEETLIRKGRDVERRVLARAVRYHLQGRVILNGARTVVFPD
ncbi:formyltetrahydrofolate deformylase [Acetobacter estunensis]|uniref:formyltetrahydrofolate deformylase n=1 Tax=Acetobacter estunensis TaxID=104097 RepID=UPI001C2D6357|nr:formyltetrahydrofolate deformylase [Acetobacter estunensis]MBV1837731.1 formyltetrahydrofolate deformylase [Acetobacter estunensis]